MLTMQRVSQACEVDAVAALASAIWNQHFVPMIGQAQVDYMLAKFQSSPAITRQLADGYEYYLALDGGQGAGYCALVPQPAQRTGQLSKLYVRQECRGRGVGKSILAFVETRCAVLGIDNLWLTVNRHNAGAIAFYHRMGFVTAGPIVADIGNGFVMDDYRMVKTIGAC
ncbi:MAG: GNAT family N-acetyltransferase [Phycisphaeraceae bacterium]